MAANHKLTAVIKGRTISGSTSADGEMTMSFSDGSKMTVKTAGAFNSGATSGTVKGVRQAGTTLSIDFDDGSTLDLHTAESTSCVMVRSAAGAMEYAD